MYQIDFRAFLSRLHCSATVSPPTAFNLGSLLETAISLSHLVNPVFRLLSYLIIYDKFQNDTNEIYICSNLRSYIYRLINKNEFHLKLMMFSVE